MRATLFISAYTAVLVTASAVSATEVTPSRRLYDIVSPSGGPTEWMGFAASWNGRIFQHNSNPASEVAARDGARSECEQTTGRTCRAIAVPTGWQVVAISCQRSGDADAFVGGSGQDAAERVALDKANDAGFRDGNCRVIYNY